VILAASVLAAAYVCDPIAMGEASDLRHLPPLFSPPHQLRLNIHLPNGDRLPEAALRGIKDEGGCGCLNADLQLIDASGPISSWLKESAPPEINSLSTFYQVFQSGEGEISSGAVRSQIGQMLPMGGEGIDPFDFLAFILDLSPKELKGAVRKTVYYNTPKSAASASDVEIKDAEIPIISLPIRGANPHLEKMLHAFYNERPIGLKRAEKGADGVVRLYRANRIERRFLTAPPELWFHVNRFENVVQKSIFNETPLLKSIFTPIERGVSKNRTPVWIPQTIEVKPLWGPSKSYRLNAFLVHEGASPQENRVKAYRFKDNAWYGCLNSWVVKISDPAEQEIRSQAYLLHYELI